MTEDAPVINFKTEIDVPHFTQMMLTDQALLIKEHGKPVPQMLFFIGEDAILTVTSPLVEDDLSRDQALIKMLMLYPSMMADTVMFCFQNTLKFEDGLADALVVLTVIHNGAYAESFPYRTVDDVVQFREGAELDTSFGQPYPLTIAHMLPTFSHTHQRIAKPGELINWLRARGFSVQYFDKYSSSNIDNLGSIILDALKKLPDASVGSDIRSGEEGHQA